MGWDDVSAAVERRIRQELKMTYAAVCREASVDTVTLWKLRDGKGGRLSPTSRAKIERALKWPTGTLEAIAEGQDPPTPGDRLDRLEQQMAELRATVLDIAEEFRQRGGP